MKALIIILVITGFIFLLPHPIRSYAVRENITPNSFDLWCWRDMSNGKTAKTYIGSFNGQLNVERVHTTLCN